MIEINDFMLKNPSMRLQPVSRAGDTILSGKIHFRRQYKEISIDDSYSLSISIPQNCPLDIPNVVETEQKIPHKSEFHINPDGSLCLGSPLRIMFLLNKTQDLNSYYEHFIIPYLFAVSVKLRDNSKGMIFDELAHGKKGVVDDYAQLFGITTMSEDRRSEQVERVLWLLTKSRKNARKKKCFCGCSKPVKHCRSYRYIRMYWKILPAIAWRHHFKEFKRYG